MNTPTGRTYPTGAGLGTIAIRSSVSDSTVVITYELPVTEGSTRSRGSTLDGEPAASGRLLTATPSSTQYETDLELADLAAGDHLYTVAATVDGLVLSGSTIFTTPAA
jgi:hypothetical protein